MAADASLNQIQVRFSVALVSPVADRRGSVAAGAAATAVAELGGDKVVMMIRQRKSRMRAVMILKIGGEWKCGAVVSVHWRVRCVVGFWEGFWSFCSNEWSEYWRVWRDG